LEKNVSLEIERKFLLKNSQILDFLKEAGVVFKHLEISQFYTKITQNEEIRFRSEEDKFIKTVLLSLLLFSSALSLPSTNEKNQSQKRPNIIVVRNKTMKSTGLDVGKAD